jgi:NAD(P)-dependent dehydrogenase (short-subunit alcohol dehydrogenase family)
MGRLEGKVALITGAGSGIGAATARRFAREGCKVALSGRHAETLAAAASAIRDEGGEALVVVADVREAAQVRAALDSTLDAFGALHILHCNAGVLIPGAVHELADDDWATTVAINLTGTFLCAKHAIPALRAAGGGSIIFTSSSSGIVGDLALAAYNATKTGLLGLCRQMALDYARERIRVNCICPGWIDTPFNDPIYAHLNMPKESADDFIPMGRQGTPDDVAHAALFLASDEAAYITGQALIVDGGLTAQ